MNLFKILNSLITGLLISVALPCFAQNQCLELFQTNSTARARHLEVFQQFQRYAELTPKRSIYTHDVTIKDGLVDVKIGLLTRAGSNFNRMLLRGLKEGVVTHVSAGTIIGPKVLSLLNQLRFIRPQNGVTFTIDGQFYPKDLIQKQERNSRVLMLKNAHVEDWTEAEVGDFKKSLLELQLDKAYLDLPEEKRPILLKFHIDSNRPTEVFYEVLF